MTDPTPAEFKAAQNNGQQRLKGPRAEAAYYDLARNRIVIRLTTGIEIGFAPADAQGLENATTDDLAEIEIEPFGLGIRFPRLDADLYVPALLEGILGSKSWMAARLGAAGGRTRSPAKALAARANGKSGGRPRKTAGRTG